MCSGIALAYGDLPLPLIAAHGLDAFVHERGGEKEIRFLYRATRPVLPVWHGGELKIVRWGGGPSRVEPGAGWVWLAAVADLAAAPVEIPATLGFANGIWFRITQGIRGVLVEDQAGPAAFMVIEPASHYYEMMTRSKRMPVLIGERI